MALQTVRLPIHCCRLLSRVRVNFVLSFDMYVYVITQGLLFSSHTSPSGLFNFMNIINPICVVPADLLSKPSNKSLYNLFFLIVIE